MDLNLNTTVEVVLTEYGVQALKKWNSQFPPGVGIHKDIGQPMRVALWELMQIFGPGLYMGTQEVPFKDNSIRLLEVR